MTSAHGSPSSPANLQDDNAGNVGDIAKHAALLELAQLAAERAPAGFDWLDTHAYRLRAPRSPAQAERWRAELAPLLARHPAYEAYARLEDRSLASGEYLCSSGLVLGTARGLAGSRAAGRVRAFLLEAHEATRNELAAQVAALPPSRVRLALLATDARRLREHQAAFAAESGAVLALIDPLPPHAGDWERAWTDEVSGWPSARWALERLWRPGQPGLALLYQWRRGEGAVTWPEAPAGWVLAAATSARPVTGKPSVHHLACLASADLAAEAAARLGRLGWP